MKELDLADTAEGASESVAPVHTPCKNCTFAVYEGKTQTGCAAGRLDNFRRKGVEILEVFDAEGFEFFVVNKHRCNYHRTWPKDADLTDSVAKVKQEAALAFEVVIPVALSDSLDEAVETVRSFERQSHKPVRVTVVLRENVRSDGTNLTRVGPLPSQVTRLFDGVNLDVQVRETLRTLQEAESVDDATATSKSHYYVWAKPGQVYPADFLDSLSRAHNDDLVNFLALKPAADGRGTVVHTKFSQRYANLPCKVCDFDPPQVLYPGIQLDETLLKDIVDKADYFCRKYQSTHLIKSADELCPSLKQ